MTATVMSMMVTVAVASKWVSVTGTPVCFLTEVLNLSEVDTLTYPFYREEDPSPFNHLPRMDSWAVGSWDQTRV